MRFWRIHAPDYTSDYQNSNLNGSIESQLRFPGVDCHVCMVDWSWAGLRSVPFECPDSLRSEMSAKGHRRSLFRVEHAKLQAEVLKEANIQGGATIEVGPGYRFPPLILDIPSRPRSDFLWPDSALLVSARILDLLVDLCRQDIATFPVTLRKVGKRNAKLPTLIPKSGEPEDIINEVPLLNDPSTVGPYYEVIPRCASYESPNRIIESQCSACGRIQAKIVRRGTTLRMAEDTWRGHSLFYLGGTLHIVITEDVKNALRAMRPSNLQLTEVELA